MRNQKLSIRKIVSYLNNPESEGGGFWLPNIQRPFVWSEEQIARLFDSIMREYPISTLLIWKTREVVKHRKFIENYHRDIRLTDFYVPDNSQSKLMVLDGQQRLQSLFIGLRGSYCGTDRELYFDILSGDLAAPEDIRFRFAFLTGAEAGWPWVKFKDIVFSHQLESKITRAIRDAAPVPLTPAQAERVEENVGRSRKEFHTDDNITYQELDGIDNPEAYQVNDIVEIFIRANSGGTKLGKSDLLFSLLISSWEEADGEMELLLEDLNAWGFAFDRDFVLKTCLSLLGKGAQYDVKKFRDGSTKEQIVQNWDSIAESIRQVRDDVISRTFIRSDKALPSYLALIPLIYLRYHYPQDYKSNPDFTEYLLRSLITGAFSGSPDKLIDKINRNIDEHKGFRLSEIFGVIRSDNRNLDITPDVIYQQGYGSRTIHLFFNLWYQDFNYKPASDANGPQVDHIFPQSLLKTVKIPNPDTGKMNLLRYRAEQRDQIANCMLLSAEENGFQEKSGTPPSIWFARDRFASDEAHRRYLDLHLIPKDPALWKLERFDDFIDARKELLKQKFAHMLRGEDVR